MIKTFELPNIRWNAELDGLRSEISEVTKPYVSATEEENGKSYFTFHLVTEDFGDWIHSHNDYFKHYLQENRFGDDEVEVTEADITEDSLGDYLHNGFLLYTLFVRYKMIKKN